MNICVIGAKGVVGSAVANYFNSFGHDIIRQDISDGDGITLDMSDAIIGTDFIFVCVPTPPKHNGSCDISIVEKVTKDMRDIAIKEYCELNIVYKSTMPPGSTSKMESILSDSGIDVNIAYNPEFLRQKHALEDMMNPSRVIVGSPNSEFGINVMNLYSQVKCFKDIYNNYESAELVKYYANSYYAARISFFNQMKLFADVFGCEHDRIVQAIAADKSVGVHGSKPTGKPYGGACLPKDVNAIIACGRENGVDVRLLEDVERLNNIATKKISNDTISKWVN
jgi:UDPglucose 6-dehydrogenase